MSGSSRRKDKNERIGEDDLHEGTSARTRPYSFDEIMTRRKNKSLVENEKEGGSLRHELGHGVSDHYAIEKSNNGYKKDSSFNGQHNLSEEGVKASARKKEGTINVKDEDVCQGKERNFPDTRTKLKSVVNRDVGTEVESKHDEKTSEKRKSDVWKRNHSENEAGKTLSRDVIEKDRDGRADRGRGKSERDNKRKHKTGVDEKHRESDSSSKHDARKRHELESSERKERKELSKSHYEESSLKRRRSRSRERDDRHKRSRSVSPSANKHAHHHGRGHGELSSHSLKERPGRQHSDADRNKITSNGSNSHYRRHGASTSRLGGYSPRKRRSEAAVKTPSPPKRSPEKKSAKWDLAPERKDGSFSALLPSPFHALNQNASSNLPEVLGSLPDASAILKRLSGVSPSSVLSNKSSSTDTVQLTEATRPMRRLYVENIPASASEKAVMECLNNFLISSGLNHIQGTQPCISCFIHKGKSQALVEFLTPEDATAAISFDGSSFSGSIIKIRRPKDFVEVATGEPEKSVPAVDAISNVVSDSVDKIFIGGISKILSSQMLLEIASAFGPLKAYQFERNMDPIEPCAYLEYADRSITLKACAGLNGMKLGGQVITAVVAGPDVSSLGSSGNQKFFEIPEHARPLLEKPMHVLKLKNMFNPETLPSLCDAEIEEVLEDVRLECVRFGTVKSVNVVKCIANPLSTSEACEVKDNVTSAHTQQKSVCDETIAKTEAPYESLDHKTRIGNSIENPNSTDDLIDDNKPADDLVKDEPHQPGHESHFGDAGGEDTTNRSPSDAKEIPHEIGTSKDESPSRNDVVTDNSQTEEIVNVDNKSTSVEGLNLVKVSGEIKEGNNSPRIGSDAMKTGESKVQDCNLGHIFEAGCVFVEFTRTEAACTAAHCLHGRLFDGRAVAVEYVPLDSYRARFPK